MSINDFVRCCVTRPDGKLLCWDVDRKQYVVVTMQREVVSIADLTTEEIVALKEKVDSDKKPRKDGAQ